MKVNKIFMALAAMAMVGCSSEDVMDFTANQAPEDSNLIELDPNFVLAGVGEDDGVTRTHWEQDAETKALVNKFLPIYAKDVADGELLSDDAILEAQSVGLCWLGQGAVGTDVYTNYQFYHFGWLNNDETEADLDCNALLNGSLYSDVKLKANKTAISGAEAVPSTDFTLLAKSMKSGKDNLNYNSGVYQTKNKAIFGGQYIVYYPFNTDFKEAGTIPAIAPTLFSPASTEFTTKELGSATFRYSAPVTIEGGSQAAGFGLKNLSALVQLKVSAPKGDDAIGDFIDQIILYSPSQKLLKQANLAADKIVAGKTGADLYASTEGTKTITATFGSGDEVELRVAKAAAKGAFITVLPTTVDDLKVLVHNKTQETWATIDMGNTEFKAGSAKVLNISVTDADFEDSYTAVDDASLRQALTEARKKADKDHPQTITVIGDVKLTASLDINDAKDEFITVKGDVKGDAIIVPQDVVLTVKKATIEADVHVLGKSCCDGKKGGWFIVSNATIVGNVTMVPTEARVKTEADYNKYNPTLSFDENPSTVAAGKTIDVKAGNVDVIKAVNYKGDIKIAEGAKVTVKGTGDLNFMGGTVLNEGTIEVLKGGKFDMTDKDGNATADDGKRMTNKGTFIHNVDAAVGTAVQSMDQQGEYRCRVDDQVKLDDAYLKWTACSVIEMVNAPTKGYDLKSATTHNKKYVDIEVNAGSTETKFVTSGAAIGNLTAKSVLGIAIGPKALTVNGDMNIYANTELTSSKGFTVTGNVNVVKDGTTAVTLTYKAGNTKGFKVTGDITIDAATFDASEKDAKGITCANFYLKNVASATFGPRTDGETMIVSNTIDNPKDCVFTISPATTTTVIAWITCKTLKVGGSFPGGRPLVVE